MIGNIICELRKERNLSQKKLADAIGVNQATIAKIEINRNEATASTIRKLANYFEVSSDYLLELEDDFGSRIPAAMHTPALTAEESKILEQYRSLPEQLRKLIRQQLDVYSSPEELLSKSDKKV